MPWSTTSLELLLALLQVQLWLHIPGTPLAHLRTNEPGRSLAVLTFDFSSSMPFQNDHRYLHAAFADFSGFIQFHPEGGRLKQFAELKFYAQ
jgi:hypothetical protein